MGERNYQKQFTIVKKINKGTSGQVFKVIRKKDNKVYALKLIENLNTLIIEQMERQVKIMQILNSPYTLKIIDSFQDQFNGSYVMVSEFMEKGDLEGRMKKKQFIKTNEQLLSFIMQISLAFTQLNTKNIIHRDLKPANILIADDGSYKVCDFGCSKFLAEGENYKLLKISTPFGTQLYNSPEIYFAEKGANYNKSVDVWPLGVILYENIYEKHPLKIKDNTIVTNDLIAVSQGKRLIQYPPIDNVDIKIIDLMKKMLSVKYENRINWVGIVEHVISNFDYIIYNVEQILDHQVNFTKILCLFLHHLNNEQNLKLFLDKEINDKFNILTSCLVIYQYEKLIQTENILDKKIKPKEGYTLLPHIFEEFKDKEKTEQFYKMKEKSKKFRDQIKQSVPIQKLQLQIQKCSTEMWKYMQAKHTTEHYRKHYQMLTHLSSLRKNFILKNTNYVEIMYDKFI